MPKTTGAAHAAGNGLIPALALGAALAAFASLPIQAQVYEPKPKAAPEDTLSTDPNRVPTPQMRPGETLTEHLDRNDGVIRPQERNTPAMSTVMPPEPHPNTTPVIPPPGTRGGDPDVRPE
ncbi:hypothetical protein KKP04_00800 [Rhodomicrobium sp. Az07]|uniref:hypothetical protein n=1 Tax=Rhodomicrobium sp. Az07 TaxID=2839034 RepID=UPI001BE6ADDA|nr:hypothetical protein [Rhodomicrobium sp. Az07]MBT3069409.1 hypothetical protein [Rhodomicrobium sp. Az07]